MNLVGVHFQTWLCLKIQTNQIWKLTKRLINGVSIDSVPVH